MNERRLEVARQWLEKADHDLRNARHTLTLEENCPYDTVCFHAQQCVEKSLKALLTFCAIDFPKIHDLTELLVLIPKSSRFGIDPSELAILNPYAVEARYPGDWDDVSREEAQQAVEVAGRICREIRTRLP